MEATQDVKGISVAELKQLMDEQEDFQLIDVREPDEHEFCNIGGELIPLGAVLNSVNKISREKTVVVYCRSGRRSGDIIKQLQDKFGFTNLYNLTGGILAWSDEIDDSIPKY